MASDYSINFSAKLDTSDIKNKINELQQLQSNLNGNLNSSASSSHANVSNGNVDQVLNRLTSIIQSLQRSIEKINQNQTLKNGNGSPVSIGGKVSAEESALLSQLKSQLPNIQKTVSSATSSVAGVDTRNIIDSINKSLIKLGQTVDSKLSQTATPTNRQNVANPLVLPQQIHPQQSKIIPPVTVHKSSDKPSDGKDSMYYTPQRVANEIANMTSSEEIVRYVQRNIGTANLKKSNAITDALREGKINQAEYDRLMSEHARVMNAQYDAIARRGNQLGMNLPVHQQPQQNGQQQQPQQPRPNTPFRPFGMDEYQKRIATSGVGFVVGSGLGGAQQILEAGGDSHTANVVGSIKNISETTAMGGLMGGAIGAGIGFASSGLEEALKALADSIRKTVDEVEETNKRFSEAKQKDDVVSGIREKQLFQTAVRNENSAYFDEKIKKEQMKYDRASAIIDETGSDDESFRKFQQRIESQRRLVEEIAKGTQKDIITPYGIHSQTTVDKDGLELAKQQLARMEEMMSQRDNALKDMTSSSHALNVYKSQKEILDETAKSRNRNYEDIQFVQNLKDAVKSMSAGNLSDGIYEASEKIYELNNQIKALAESGDTSKEATERLERMQRQLKQAEMERAEYEKQLLTVNQIRQRRDAENMKNLTTDDDKARLAIDEKVNDMWKSVVDGMASGKGVEDVVFDSMKEFVQTLKGADREYVQSQLESASQAADDGNLASASNGESTAKARYDATKAQIERTNAQRSTAYQMLDDIQKQNDANEFKARILDITSSRNMSTASKIKSLQSILDDNGRTAELAHADKVESLRNANRTDITEEERKAYLDDAKQKDADEKLALGKVAEARSELIAQLQERLNSMQAPDMNNVNSLASQGYMISRNDDEERLQMQTNYLKEQTDLQRQIRDQQRQQIKDSTFS